MTVTIDAQTALDGDEGIVRPVEFGVAPLTTQVPDFATVLPTLGILECFAAGLVSGGYMNDATIQDRPT